MGYPPRQAHRAVSTEWLMLLALMLAAVALLVVLVRH